MVPLQQSLHDDYEYSIEIDLRAGSDLRNLLKDQLDTHVAYQLQVDVTLYELVPVTEELLHAHHHHSHLRRLSRQVSLIRRQQAHRRSASVSSMTAACGTIPESAADFTVPRMQTRARIGFWAFRHRLPKRVFKRFSFLQNVFSSTIVRYPIVGINALSVKLQNTGKKQNDAGMPKEQDQGATASHVNIE